MHSLISYPLSLFFFVKDKPPVVLAPSTAPRPSMAICLSAYNEADVIAEKIETVIAMRDAYGPATIHVYADCPSDGTLDILRGYEAQIDLVAGDRRRGKTYGMNILAARSASELIMFTDANVRSDYDAAIELARPFADASVGMATAQLIYSNANESPTSKLGAVYWSIEEWIKRVESRKVGLIGCDGAMFVVRRSAYSAPPPDLIDDLYLSLRTLIQRLRVISVDHVLVFERSATGKVEEKRRKQRIACQALNVHRHLWPQLRRMPALPFYAYVSHRLLKWMMPFTMLGAAIFAVVVLFLLLPWHIVLSAAAIVSLALFVAERIRFRPLALINSAVLSLYGVGSGVVESIFVGNTYSAWEPALSVRNETIESQ